jgi:DNA replication initiation complex subunit (GINS family)
MKTIEFYSREVYGNRLEYVVNKADADIIRKLTGKKTITGVERELIRDLTGKSVEFKEVLAPKN